MRRTSGRSELDRVAEERLRSVESRPRIEFCHVFGRQTLLIEVALARQAADVRYSRRRGFVELLYPLEQRIPTRNVTEHTARVIVLPLEPPLNLGILQILHVAIRIFDLVSVVVIDHNPHRCDRCSDHDWRWRRSGED